MGISDSEKEVPYNDESDASGKGGLTGLFTKRSKKHKGAKSNNSLASEESSVPPGRSGFHGPSEDEASEESSVPDGRSGFYEPPAKEKKEVKLPKFGAKSRTVNMTGDVEDVGDKASVSGKSEASEESVEWISDKVLMGLGVLLLVMFSLLIAVVSLAATADPPTNAPSMAPTGIPTTMPSRNPTNEPTIKPRDPIPVYANYYNEFRISVQNSRRQGYLATLEGTSPQAQAFQWITKSGSNCCSPTTLAMNLLFERYIMTTILFGTRDGYPWPDNWRVEWKEKSVCDWRNSYGIWVYCDSGGLIRELNLRNLYVGDEFPPEVGLLQNLQVLSLASWDGIGFTIPMEVGRLQNLEFLKISSTTNLEGTIPTEVGQLTKLTILSLRDNHLDGTLPSEVGNLSILHTLQLDNNSFTGNLPGDIGRIGTLQHLVLSHNEFDSTIPNEVNQLTTLAELRLDENMFSGAIPNNLQSLTGLRWLNLENNVDEDGNVLLQGNLNALCDAGGGQPLLNFKADCNNAKITCNCCFCFG